MIEEDGVLPTMEEFLQMSANFSVWKKFMHNFVSIVRGKLEYNKLMATTVVNAVVSPSDEAFAYLVLERNMKDIREDRKGGKGGSNQAGSPFATAANEGGLGREKPSQVYTEKTARFKELMQLVQMDRGCSQRKVAESELVQSFQEMHRSEMMERKREGDLCMFDLDWLNKTSMTGV